jgi:hypothetical protein
MNSKKPATRIDDLPALPLDEWSDTKLTLHLYFQIVGKIRLALTPPHNHWWHVPLYVNTWGVTTSPIPFEKGAFEISFDFVEHVVQVSISDGRRESIELRGQSVSEFYDELFAVLDRSGIGVRILARPFDLEGLPDFPADKTNASYDRDYVNRFWRTLVFAHTVLYEFGGRFVGKKTPVHLFWHSFDLALTFFSGKSVPAREGAGIVEREAYSHEVISFGYWAGDDRYPAPAFYSYVFPEPNGLRDQKLQPSSARWLEQGGGSLAVLPYEDIRSAPDPRALALQFLQSSYEAGGKLGGWDMKRLRYNGPQ